MKKALCLLVVTLGMNCVHAAGTRVVQAAKLLSAGEYAEMAKWFIQPTGTTVTELQALGRHAGKLDQIVKVSSMPTGQTSRVGVITANLPAHMRFKGEFATATSSEVGSVWLQVSTPLDGRCRLFTLYVNTPA
jgi:hypothetical protein